MLLCEMGVWHECGGVHWQDGKGKEGVFQAALNDSEVLRKRCCDQMDFLSNFFVG